MSGGIFHNTCVHGMDSTCWILNEEPIIIHAVGRTHSQGIWEAQDVDTVIITMQYPSGTISINDLSQHSTYGYDHCIKVLGSNGTLRCNNPPSDDVSTSPAIFKRFEQAYLLELDYFLDMINDPQKTVMVQRRDALQVSQLAEACETSYKTGQVVSF